jgi:DNA-binding MarR family transcriptional regulator
MVGALELGNVLLGAAAALRAHRRALSSTVGPLSSTEYAVIAHVALRGGGHPGEIAQAQDLSTGAVSACIDRLAERGLLERRPDRADGRRVRVIPTDRCTRALADADGVVRQAADRAALRLGQRDGTGLITMAGTALEQLAGELPRT